MSTTTSGTQECPRCGRPYEQQIIVEQGMQWDDLFPGTPLDFFKRYHRRCTAQYDATDDSHLTERKRAIYFHTGEDDSHFN